MSRKYGIRAGRASPFLGVCLIVLFGLVACGASPTVVPSPDATTPPSVATPLATVTLPTLAPLATLPVPAATPDVVTPITVTIWVPEDFATGAERGGDVLETQLAQFEALNPNININYVLKASYDKGGIVDWLTQLHDLMPDRLPDAAIVDSRELDRIEQLGLLQPLSHDLPSGSYWDLFAPAQEIAHRGGRWMDQPLTLDAEHLVYDADSQTPPPTTWDEVLETKTQVAFAAESTDTFLLQYLANGGSLNPTEHPALDTSIMQGILDYYQRARANGNLSENTSLMNSSNQVYPLFSAHQVPIAQVQASDFMLDRSRMQSALAAAVPTRDGHATSLVSGWSYVILTNDPARHQAAAEYLAWLDDPQRLGAWAAVARMIPASKNASAQAVKPRSYAGVLWTLLGQGIASPSLAQQAPYAAAWHTAVQAVLDGQLAPGDAAFRAISSLTQ